MSDQTERLRALLDERGVEWEDMSIRPYVCTLWRDPDGEPCTALEGADDIPDGKLSAQALLTPEQAIAATLGDSDATGARQSDAGTCHNIHEPPKDTTFWPAPHFKCSECGATHVSMGYVYYCPNCGRKVVDDG